MSEPKKVIVSEKLKAFLARLPDDNNCCVGSPPLEEPAVEVVEVEAERLQALEQVAKDALVTLVTLYGRKWHLPSWQGGLALECWTRAMLGMKNKNDEPFHPELKQMRHLRFLTNGWVHAVPDRYDGEWVPIEEWRQAVLVYSIHSGDRNARKP